MTKDTKNGAQAFFSAMVDAGITDCFANPGTSEMQLVYEMGLSDDEKIEALADAEFLLGFGPIVSEAGLR